MRLDQLIEELRHASEYGNVPPEFEVTVVLDGNQFAIERVDFGYGDGVVITLET